MLDWDATQVMCSDFRRWWLRKFRTPNSLESGCSKRLFRNEWMLDRSLSLNCAVLHHGIFGFRLLQAFGWMWRIDRTELAWHAVSLDDDSFDCFFYPFVHRILQLISLQVTSVQILWKGKTEKKTLFFFMKKIAD